MKVDTLNSKCCPLTGAAFGTLAFAALLSMGNLLHHAAVLSQRADQGVLALQQPAAPQVVDPQFAVSLPEETTNLVFGSPTAGAARL